MTLESILELERHGGGGNGRRRRRRLREHWGGVRRLRCVRRLTAAMLLMLMVLLVLLPSSTHAETGAGGSSALFDCVLLPLRGTGLHPCVGRFDWRMRYSIAVAAVADGLQMAFRRATQTSGQALETRAGFANAKVIGGCSSVGWMAGTTLFQLLLRLLRAASASACGDGCGDYGGRASELLEIAGPSTGGRDD